MTFVNRILEELVMFNGKQDQNNGEELKKSLQYLINNYIRLNFHKVE